VGELKAKVNGPLGQVVTHFELAGLAAQFHSGGSGGVSKLAERPTLGQLAECNDYSRSLVG
jgi:hypothetical protein